MKLNYYKSEYTKKGWQNVIDTALSYGAKLSYSKYGNICTIDTTEVEDIAISQNTDWSKSENELRMIYAEAIFSEITQSGMSI